MLTAADSISLVPVAAELAPTSDSHFHKLAQTLKARAWADVGVDGAQLALLMREHEALRANQDGLPLQRAAAVLDLAARRQLMRRIATAYARLHLRAPKLYLWLGFAAIAVNDGVLPTAELAIATARLAHAMPRPISRRVAGLAEDGVKAAFQVNFAIFADLYWVHRAYLEGGLLWLRGLYRCGALSRELFDAFATLDRGRQEGAAALIDEGNCLLFRHEQAVSVTPVFHTYRRALSASTVLGCITLPNRELKACCQRLTLRASFGRTGSYGPFAARWQWLAGCGWTAFANLSQERPTTLRREVERALWGRPEGALGQLRRLAATVSVRCA